MFSYISEIKASNILENIAWITLPSSKYVFSVDRYICCLVSVAITHAFLMSKELETTLQGDLRKSVYVCLTFCVCVYVSPPPTLCICAYVPVSQWVSLCASMCLSMCEFLCMTVSVWHLYFMLVSLCMYVPLFVFLSVSLSVTLCMFFLCL